MSKIFHSVLVTPVADSDLNRQGGLLMVAETISLGILSLPQAMATLGIVPGVIVLLASGIIAIYTGYVIGKVCRIKAENT